MISTIHRTVACTIIEAEWRKSAKDHGNSARTAKDHGNSARTAKDHGNSARILFCALVITLKYITISK